LNREWLESILPCRVLVAGLAACVNWHEHSDL
jgi:hypothetical protein